MSRNYEDMAVGKQHSDWEQRAWCEKYLPFGVRVDPRTWETIIVNRKHQELWVTGGDGWLVPGDRIIESVDHYFWDEDWDPPWESERTRARCHDILQTWGVPIWDPFAESDVLYPAPESERRVAFRQWGRGAGGVPGAECWVA